MHVIASGAKQSMSTRCEEWIASSLLAVLPPVKHHAGDDEHRRHRQHLRKRLRGRPLGGFLHAVSLDLGVTHRCAKRLRRSSFLLGTPRDEYSLSLSPHSANIDRAKFEQQCGGILTQPCCFRVSCRIGFCNPFDENNPNETS